MRQELDQVKERQQLNQASVMPQENQQHYDMHDKDQVSSQDTAVLLVNRKRIAAPNVEIVDLRSENSNSGSKVLVAPMV